MYIHLETLSLYRFKKFIHSTKCPILTDKNSHTINSILNIVEFYKIHYLISLPFIDSFSYLKNLIAHLELFINTCSRMVKSLS